MLNFFSLLRVTSHKVSFLKVGLSNGVLVMYSSRSQRPDMLNIVSSHWMP